MLHRLLREWFLLVITVTCLGHISRCGETEEGDAEHQRDSPGSAVPGDDRAPPGHLLPLGSHRPHEGHITVVDGFLDPSPFHRQYMEHGKPVIFKGAANGLPAIHTWGDDEYLDDEYGNLMVEAEVGKKENRSDELSEIPLSEFLENYEEADIYMVQDVHPEMLEELGLPRPAQCGGLQDRLITAVIWFSSGETTSVLHTDEYENIHCILDGTKKFTLIDRMHREQVEEDWWDDDRGYSLVDVDKVDMKKFPHLKDVPWWSAEIEKGDCIYIPVKWYHSVQAYPGRNMGLNFWFTHLLWFNETHCKEEVPQLQDFTPLTDDSFSDSDEFEMARNDLFMVFEGLEVVYQDDAIKLWTDLLDEGEIAEIFQIVDANKDMALSWEEIVSADMESLLGNFPFLARPDWEPEFDLEEVDDDDEDEEDWVRMFKQRDEL